MKYLLIEPAINSKAYNIALMKYARWCEINGHEYQYIRGIVKSDIIPNKILMSCVFTYYSKRVETTINYYLKKFPQSKIKVGGVFPTLDSEWFNNRWNTLFEKRIEIHKGIDPTIENLIPKWNVKVKDEDLFKSKDAIERAKSRQDSIVMYSSRGCVNKCGYCCVPKLEGKMRSFPSIKEYIDTAKEELPNAKSIVLYDNNFTEHEYFFDICDELIESGLPVDIHGLHVDAFTEDKAEKFSEMTFGAQGKEDSTPYLRFSFDKIKYRDNIHKALKLVDKYDIKATFFCYVLFNWIDTPMDFWKRIVYTQEMVDDVGRSIYLFPQRYEPFAALEKNKYIGKHWTEKRAKGLKRMVTFLHGFLPISTSHNIYNWIGRCYDEFIERVEYMGSSSGTRLIKKDDIPLTLDELKKDIINH